MRRAREGPSRMGSRLRRALVAMALLFVVLAAADVLAEAARPSVLREAVHAVGVGQEASAGLWETASVRGGRETEEAPAVPEGFEDEVVSLAEAREIRVDEGNGVVGFVSSESSEAAFSAIAEELEDGGWTQVPSGWATCGSFVKGEGRYRWAFVACTGAGGATSVVVQYATSKEGR